MYSAELWMGLALTAVIIFFTTANAAIRRFSRVQLMERLEKRGRAYQLDRLIEERNDLLVGSAIIRMTATLAMILLITHAVLDEPASAVTPYALIFILSMVVISVVGVAIPHAWVRYGSESFLVHALPVLLICRVLVYPFLALQHVFDAVVRRLAGIPRSDTSQDEAQQIGKEILDVISEGELAGAVHEEDADMIESVMEFRDTDVAHIMTPRTEMVALPASASLAEAKQLIIRHGHSRIPVYSESIDDIKGVLYAKDLLSLQRDDEFDALEMMRKVPFVPETKRVADLLQELREKQVHLAIVVDEYGGTAGLVTIEDIVEEIVGEIADEYEAPEPEPIRRIDGRTIEIDARVHIDELNEELNVQLPEDADYDTVGGFIFSAMGRIPVKGEEFQYSNIRFHILDAEERKINRLRVEVGQEDGAVA